MVELSLRQELRFANEGVAVELLRLAKLVVEAVLYILEAGLHGVGQGLDDQAVQVSVVVLDDGRRTTTSQRTVLNEIPIAPATKAKSEDANSVGMLSRLIYDLVRRPDSAIGE